MLTVDQQTFRITMDAGDQEKVKFTVVNADGTPYVGGSATIAFIAKRSLDDLIGAAVMNIISNVQASQWDLANWNTGIAILEFIAANTSALGGVNLNYAVRIQDGSGKYHTPRVGLMEIRKNAGI